MARPRNRFQGGSGCYSCGMCSRLTRDTGGDNTQVQLCEQCYELCGIENMVADGHRTEEQVHDRMESLKQQIVALGGVL